jgi:mannose-6-phosphate isomerase class I
MNPKKQNWSDISTAPISEAAIRALHVPAENFKVYVNTHEAGTNFTARAGHAFVLYVVAGSCKAKLDGTDISLQASELIALKKGSYAFDVVGNEALTIVKVFPRL